MGWSDVTAVPIYKPTISMKANSFNLTFQYHSTLYFHPYHFSFTVKTSPYSHTLKQNKSFIQQSSINYSKIHTKYQNITPAANINHHHSSRLLYIPMYTYVHTSFFNVHGDLFMLIQNPTNKQQNNRKP